MPSTVSLPTLADSPLFPYLDALGSIPPALEGKIGVYAIFDHDETLQLVAFSRNIFQSLKQHLVRCPERCYWLKVKTVERPSRSYLSEIQQSWIAANGVVPPGNGAESDLWQAAIDVKNDLTAAEQTQLDQSEASLKPKLLKQLARQREADILARLADRGVQMDIRFNPKQKELGLLDLK
jgi:hypothetical protein